MHDELKSFFYSYENSDSYEKALIVAGDLIKGGIDLLPELESALIVFLTNKNDESFVSLSKVALSQNLFENYSENLNLIVILAKKKLLPLGDVAHLLNSIPYTERSSLKLSYQKLLEVADLVCEDISDGIMDADDDDLLLNALENA